MRWPAAAAPLLLAPPPHFWPLRPARVVAAVEDAFEPVPSWSALAATWREAATPAELAFREQLASGRLPHASALATKRLFDLPDGEEPQVILYRDTAAWCPYCEKVWLVLEEKQVPYSVEKVNMRCYGDKPGSFLAIQPSGAIPIVRLGGDILRESDEIIRAIERAFPQRPLLPSDVDKPDACHRIQPLLTLERELFSSWLRWLTSAAADETQRRQFEELLSRVDEELRGGGGPYFLGTELSVVDCVFAPFLERMAASCAYYKGLMLRRNARWRATEEKPPR